jgi:hypothetical protein
MQFAIDMYGSMAAITSPLVEHESIGSLAAA